MKSRARCVKATGKERASRSGAHLVGSSLREHGALNSGQEFAVPVLAALRPMRALRSCARVGARLQRGGGFVRPVVAALHLPDRTSLRAPVGWRSTHGACGALGRAGVAAH